MTNLAYIYRYYNVSLLISGQLSTAAASLYSNNNNNNNNTYFRGAH